jgi:DNA-binding NtrC family response regulator
MRKLLVLTASPLGDEVTKTLRRNDWKLLQAAAPGEAQKLIARNEVLVGLAVLGVSDAEEQIARVTQLIRHERGIRWVVALDRAQIDQDAYLSLIAEEVYDFLSLPLDENRLAVILGHAYGMAEVGCRFLERQRVRESGRFGLIGDSPPMRALFQEIQRAAACEVPVVLVGETGTGKEMAARAIHESSAVADGPFVAINCAAIPASLIQAELYGYERGAFTDASEPRGGYLEAADGGTLFLNEIAELPLESQASLLRFLELGQVVRLGSSQPRRVAARVISATNAGLEGMVQHQRFRLDLFYRLQVLTINLPPLRARGEDISTLAQHFFDELARDNDSKAMGFSRAALAVMDQYDWPGNLRELRNRVHQAALYAQGPFITPADLRLERRTHRRDLVTLQEAREAAEKDAIRSALRRTGQNMTRAAEQLQISRMTLYRLLQKHGVEQVRELEVGHEDVNRLGIP